MSNINLVQTARGSLEVRGADGADLGCTFAETEWLAASVSKRFFVAPRAVRVHSLYATVTVSGTDTTTPAPTAVIKKVPSASPMTSGTVLHSSTINLAGTADTVQTLTLSTTASDLDLAKGDSLAIVFTGVLTAATGIAQVGLAWK